MKLEEGEWNTDSLEANGLTKYDLGIKRGRPAYLNPDDNFSAHELSDSLGLAKDLSELLPENLFMDRQKKSSPRAKVELPPPPKIFQGLEKPDLLTYDAIGFDADNGLVQFNRQELMLDITEVLLHELHEDASGEYPADVLEVGYERTIEIAMELRNPVFDVTNGNVLQLHVLKGGD